MSKLSACIAYRLVPFTPRSTGEHYIANVYIEDADLLCQSVVKRDKHSGSLSIVNWWPITLVSREWIEHYLTFYLDVERVHCSQKQFNMIEDIAYGLIGNDDLPEFDIEPIEPQELYDSIDIEAMQKDAVIVDDPQKPTVH